MPKCPNVDVSEKIIKTAKPQPGPRYTVFSDAFHDFCYCISRTHLGNLPVIGKTYRDFKTGTIIRNQLAVFFIASRVLSEKRGDSRPSLYSPSKSSKMLVSRSSQQRPTVLRPKRGVNNKTMHEIFGTRDAIYAIEIEIPTAGGVVRSYTFRSSGREHDRPTYAGIWYPANDVPKIITLSRNLTYFIKKIDPLTSKSDLAIKFLKLKIIITHTPNARWCHLKAPMEDNCFELYCKFYKILMKHPNLNTAIPIHLRHHTFRQKTFKPNSGLTAGYRQLSVAVKCIKRPPKTFADGATHDNNNHNKYNSKNSNWGLV
ncbi:hypothetical protein QTP88_002294 [Uroleucon formosanum]